MQRSRRPNRLKMRTPLRRPADVCRSSTDKTQDDLLLCQAMAAREWKTRTLGVSLSAWCSCSQRAVPPGCFSGVFEFTRLRSRITERITHRS